MKTPHLVTLCALIALVIHSNAANVDLTTFGSNDYLVDGGSTTATYSQGSSSLTFNYSPGFGDTIGGQTVVGGVTPTILDWSAYTNPASYTGFGITMSLIGTNNNIPFTLALLDDSFATVASYQGSTAGLSSTPSIAPLSLTPGGNANFASIAGMQFTWDGPGSQAVNTTLTTMVAIAVPEPSTYFLLAISGVALGSYVMRRRKRA